MVEEEACSHDPTEPMTRLPRFIREHTDEILADWEAFARTLPMAESMNVAALRDHAKEMLGVIARDLETAQTAGEQSAKAEGKSDAGELGPPSTAAQEHGAARAASGFTIAQMLSELRALRASVIRLWTAETLQLAATDLEDMTRFNEAIDQAIAESVTQYSEEIGQSRERFLAVLGHDLRNPLGAIITSSSFMLELDELAERDRALVRGIASSARRMNQMVSDLLDFAQTSFGGEGIPIARAPMDVGRMIQDVVSEVTARYRTRHVNVETDGDLRGQWDCARLTQVLTNLVVNAVQHGTEQAPIMVAAHGAPAEVVISVRNEGLVIPREDLAQIFRPGTRAGGSDTAQDDGHLGLGLFIVDRIVAAHGGTVDVRSTNDNGTTFSVHLPRAA
jgi:signal transduction histidine kinase